MPEFNKHLYLPQLQFETANLAIPESSGVWKNNDRKIIRGISDAIIVDDSAITRGISSIPDIWARPLMFQSALNPKSDHPLHRRITQEWRGLISLLALCKIKGYPVEIVPVRLENDPFSYSLKRLAPRAVQLQQDVQYRWTDAFLIYYRTIVVGAFSPVTLVYTASDYSHKLRAESFMLRDADGYLCAPEKSFKDELKYVGHWLSNLQQWLNNDRDDKGTRMDSSHDNPDLQVVEMINELLANWLDEIREALGLPSGAEITSDAEIAGDALMPQGEASLLDTYKIYQALLYPLVQEGQSDSREKSTDMGLDFTREGSGYREVVVITEKLLREQGQIWKARFLRDLGGDAPACLERFFNAPSGDRIADANIANDDALWIRPEKYFVTNVLLRSNQSHILPEEEKVFNCGRRYVLPFTAEILRFFTPEEIVDRLKPSFKEENQVVRFSFTLPIINREGQRRTIRVEKVFRTRPASAEEGELVATDVPVLEVFPNYLGPRWRRHYVFNSQAENFEMTPVVQGRAEIISCTHDTTVDGSRTKVAITQISGDDAFPEGLALVRAEGNQEKLGLVLLERPQLRDDLEKKWTIGVDFGTSNTNVFKNVEDEDVAEPWVFNLPRYTRRIFLSADSIRQRLMRDFFVPAEKISLPIPTILKIYKGDKKDHLLLDYFIYFANEYLLPTHTHSNIKWDMEERKTEYFIRSLLFLLLIEAVAENVESAEFACSYPKAFSDTDISVLKAEWTAAFRHLLEDEHRIVESSKSMRNDRRALKIESPFFETEGVSSGFYFADKKTITIPEERARIADAAICLDVGGGTTDISVWFDKRIVADASVMFAGQEITQPLRSQSSRIREYLFSEDALVTLEEKLTAEKDFSSRLNLILRNEEKRIPELLVKYSNTRDVLWLRQMLALGFSTLAYYTAILAVATDVFLRKNGTNSDDSLLARVEKNGINLHWGGNAAKLINWVNFGVNDRESPPNLMLNAMFYNGLKQAEATVRNLGQLQSPGHKNEVAGGLVVMKRRSQNGQPRGLETTQYEKEAKLEDVQDGLKGIISGETIVLDTHEVSAIDPLVMAELFSGNKTTFKATTLEQLLHFVDCFNQFGVRFSLFKDDHKLVISDSIKERIQHDLKKYFLDLAAEDESKRKLEPVFIFEVKVLLESLRETMR